jgi:HK97 family phage portal protein
MNWKRLIPFSTQKATEIHRAIVKMLGLNPVWSKRDYETFAKEGHNANVWVYRCIQAISQGAAGVPWLLYQVDSKGKRKEVEAHEILKLLNKPNEFMSRQEFFEAYVGFALIAGNSYLDMVGPNDAAPPRELWPLRPDRMSVIPDKQHFIGGYEYAVGVEKVGLDKRRISHLKFFNPLNDFYGLAPIEVAGRGIDNDNAANAWNNSLLNNGGRPTGALITDDHLTEPQYNNLKTELDRNIKGAKNAGKPLLLEGGLKWQDMGLTPRDMDFIQSKKMSIIEICAAFNVPPEIVGYGEQKTYSNYQEARKALYEDAVIPMLDKVRDKLNADLVIKFGDNLYLDYNKDSIEAIQENRDQVYKRANEGYKGGLLTKNEARQEMGYEDVEGGDEFYTQPQPTLNIGGPTDKDEESKSHFFNVKALNNDTEELKAKYWVSMERRRSTFYKRITEKVAEQFKAEKKAVLKAFESGGGIEAVNIVNEQKTDWQKLYVNIYVEVMQTFGNQLFNQLKNDALDLEIKAPEIPLEDGFDVYDEAVQNFIANTVAHKVVLVTDTTKEMIRKIIAASEAQGWSIPQIANAIDTMYLDQIIPNRSVVIARTEVIGASNAGSRYAAQQTGLPLEKEWISTRDKRTRESHDELDGEKRPMDEPYSNGLLFPGDPSGTAKEVIQCRCTEGYNVVRD